MNSLIQHRQMELEISCVKLEGASTANSSKSVTPSRRRRPLTAFGYSQEIKGLYSSFSPLSLITNTNS